LAAVNVIPGTPDWILAKVISHDAQAGIYKLSDEDIESNKGKFLDYVVMKAPALLFLMHIYIYTSFQSPRIPSGYFRRLEELEPG
jgi:hypothetical protein